VAAAVIGVMLGRAGAAAQERQPPPLVVTFSAPVEGEADVRLDTVIRIQFSRHVDERSLAGRVRVAYSATQSAERGEAQAPALPFSLKYDPGTYAITIAPGQYLERFREVNVVLSDGIVGTDGATLAPWTLRFSTGGSK
jgi:hypothetical protein